MKLKELKLNAQLYIQQRQRIEKHLVEEYSVLINRKNIFPLKATYGKNTT